jgi:hypothetical protein
VDPPIGQHATEAYGAVVPLELAAPTLDAHEARPAHPADVEGRHARGHEGACGFAVHPCACLLGHHGHGAGVDGTGDAVDQPVEAPVALGLHQLLHGVEVHREGVGTDHLDRVTDGGGAERRRPLLVDQLTDTEVRQHERARRRPAHRSEGPAQ